MKISKIKIENFRSIKDTVFTNRSMKNFLLQLLYVLTLFSFYGCNDDSAISAKSKKIINIEDSYKLYATGSKVGELNFIVDNKDNNFKFKGKLLSTSNRKASQSMAYEFEFYVDSDKVKDKLEKYAGKLIEIKYREYRNIDDYFYLVTEVSLVN